MTNSFLNSRIEFLIEVDEEFIEELLLKHDDQQKAESSDKRPLEMNEDPTDTKHRKLWY